ncbi:hypothetical protein C0989_012667 [Termitomyces sp. Mn162]|nr:hypothetical protein C0989_012667 [Termitomyces sp. Mn162]
MRALSKPPLNSPNQSGTPKRTCFILMHSDLKSLLASDSGLVKMLPEAHKWLESNGWTLVAKLYNRTKIVSILATMALSLKLSEMRSTMLAVTLLLEADITDHMVDSIADVIATKSLGKPSGLVEKLGSTTKFLTANNAQRAESTLALKLTSKTLVGVTTLLDAMRSKLANAPN